MAHYITNGFHVRHTLNKQTGEMESKIFAPGDQIVPTNFELKQFINKFKVVATDEELRAPVLELDYTELETVKTSATIMLESPPEGVKLSAKAEKKLRNYISQNPKSQENIDKLSSAINDILTDIAIEQPGEEKGAE